MIQNDNTSCTFNIKFVINIILGNDLFSSPVPQDTKLETKAVFTKIKIDKLDFNIFKGKRVPGLWATHKNKS